MAQLDLRVLAINGGSSSIKFALFEAGKPMQRILQGAIEGIGRPGSALSVNGPNSSDNLSRPLPSSFTRW
jgi:acetate kinase